MPTHLDVLVTRLRQFDEISLLELLEIDADDILERFKDRIYQKKNYLFGEVEALNEEDALNFVDEEFELDQEDVDFNINDYIGKPEQDE